MKRLILVIMVAVTALYSCIVKQNPTKYGIFAFGEMNYGVWDVCVYDKNAFITLTSEYTSGLVDVNVSDPSLLVSYYENDKYADSNISEYFNDMDYVAHVYTDFYSGVRLIGAVNDHLVLGMTQNSIKAAVINGGGSLNTYDYDVSYYYVTDAVMDGSAAYVAFSDNDSKFKVSKVYFNEENGSFDIEDIYSDTGTDAGNAVLALSDDYIILNSFYNVYKIKKDGSEAVDITPVFDKVGAPSMLSDFWAVYNGIYLIATGGYNIYIIDLSTGDYYSKEYNTTPLAKLDGNILYVVNSGYNGVIEALDLSNPLNPAIIDTISNDNVLVGDFVIDNGKLYVAAEWGGLMVYDISTCGAGEVSEDNMNEDYCFNSQDIAALPEGKWVMAGSGCDIVDMSIFNDVTIVWAFENGEWKAYSPKSDIMDLINSNFGVLDHINAKEGFWIYK